VAAIDLARGAVTGAKIADGAVGTGEIAKGAITGAELADGGVGAADIAKGTVTGAEIADGAIGEADIAPIEPFHEIGAPGEPRFFDGGEGDCVWTSGLPNAPGTAPPGFAKDALGRVWLRGIATAGAGTGGDGRCDPADTGEAEDGLVFVLPPAYRPAFFDVSGLAHAIVIAPDAGAVLNDSTIPAGGVHSVLAATAVMDGVSVRAATAEERSASTRATVSLGALARLAR
jgi:hypothetical protein